MKTSVSCRRWIRPASRASCCTQTWTLRVIKWHRSSVERIQSQVVSTNVFEYVKIWRLSRRSPVCHTEGLPLSSEVDNTCDDWCAVAKFSKSRIRNKVPETSIFILDTRYPHFLAIQCRICRRKPLCKKKQLDPSIRFESTLTCGGQTDTGPQLVPR